ncbi:hypothetical protein D3C76_707090 [compost metagenome]
MIDVGRTELATHAERGVFLHRTGITARRETEHWRVIAAGNGDGHQLGVDAAQAIADLHAEHFVVTLASLQRLHRTGNAIGAVGQGVRPLAAAVDRDRAVGSSWRAIDGPAGRGIVIDVGRAELASDAKGSVFLHGANIVAGRETEHWRVVAAGNGDGHQLGVHATQAVSDLHRKHVIMTLANLQRLNRTGDTIGAIGQRVNPLAGVVHGDRAVDARIRTRNAPGRRGIVIDVGRTELAIHSERGVFLHRTGIIARRETEHWRIVAAGQGDRHVLGHRRPEVIGQRHREHFGLGLALGQVLRRVVVQRIGPAHATRSVACALVAHIGHQRTQRTGRRAHAGHMCVIGQVYVAEGKAAAGHRGAVFGHRPAFDFCRRHRRRVVGAGDSDGHILRYRRTLTIADGDQVSFGYCLSLGQVLRRRIVQVVRPLHRTVGRVRCFAYRREHERTKMSSVAPRLRERRHVRVIEVDVVKDNRAAGRQRVGRARSGVGVFGYRAGLLAEADRHTIIHARKLHRRGGPT